MFSPALIALAKNVLNEARAKHLRIATAESCTGGLIAGLLTEIPGSSDVVERGFVTYSNKAKRDLLGVPGAIITREGAVSKSVACAMAEGALARADAELAVAVTGVAGPTGGTAEKPVGLVHIAAVRSGRTTVHEEHHFGGIGRTEVRLKTVEEALLLLRKLI
jgi:nicotinamide-nucleotide amidase